MPHYQLLHSGVTLNGTAYFQSIYISASWNGPMGSDVDWKPTKTNIFDGVWGVAESRVKTQTREVWLHISGLYIEGRTLEPPPRSYKNYFPAFL
jgi:hypothetical protein